MTPEIITAINILFTGALIALTRWLDSRRVARKDEVDLLRAEVERLQKRVEKYEADYERERRNNLVMFEYVTRLRILLIKAGIQMPEMPELL